MAQLIKLAVASGRDWIASEIIMGRRQIFQTLRKQTSGRGGRIIKRKNHPIMFWLNFGGPIISAIRG
jgi:hypothetical protein